MVGLNFIFVLLNMYQLLQKCYPVIRGSFGTSIDLFSLEDSATNVSFICCVFDQAAHLCEEGCL